MSLIFLFPIRLRLFLDLEGVNCLIFLYPNILHAMDTERIKKNVEERKVEPEQAFFASFLSPAAESGLLGQGMVNVFADKMAPVLVQYMRALDLLDLPDSASDEERFCALCEQVNEGFEVGDLFDYEIDGNEVTIYMGGKGCRYCPKGVGLAEIPSSACPFPHLLMSMARNLDIPVNLETTDEEKVLSKEQGYCVMCYSFDE